MRGEELVAAAFAAALNHVLGQNVWARDALARHAGRSFALTAFPFSIGVRFGSDGRAEPAEAAGAEATLRLTPPAVMRYLAGDPDAWRLAELQGDATLGGSVADTLANLVWDVEADLAGVVGDVAAHRIGDLLRGLRRWQETAAASLARQTGEYLVQEGALLASREQVAAFVRGVDDLRDALARLEKRITLLEDQKG